MNLNDIVINLITGLGIGAGIGLIITEYNVWRMKRLARKLINEAAKKLEEAIDGKELEELGKEIIDYAIERVQEKLSGLISSFSFENIANSVLDESTEDSTED